MIRPGLRPNTFKDKGAPWGPRFAGPPRRRVFEGKPLKHKGAPRVPCFAGPPRRRVFERKLLQDIREAKLKGCFALLMLCFAMLCFALRRYALFYFALLCLAMICFAMRTYALLWFVLCPCPSSVQKKTDAKKNAAPAISVNQFVTSRLSRGNRGVGTTT